MLATSDGPSVMRRNLALSQAFGEKKHRKVISTENIDKLQRRLCGVWKPELVRIPEALASFEKCHSLMDIHKKVDGATAEAVAGAHARDLEVGENMEFVI